MQNNSKPLIPFFDAQSIKEIKKDPRAYLSKLNLDVDDNVEIRLIENKKDYIYFVIPDKKIFDLDLTDITAAKLGASTAGTAGTGGTLATVCSTASTVATVGTAGSAACGD